MNINEKQSSWSSLHYPKDDVVLCTIWCKKDYSISFFPMNSFVFSMSFYWYDSNGSFFYSPYLYNGKELDEETGLYYYGARYYDPKMSVWYSVDRFADKYPFASPYCYGLNNPVKYKDIFGDSLSWATNMILNENPISFLYYCGSLITTLEAIAKTRMQVKNNTDGAIYYFNYLKAFEEKHRNISGDAYNGVQRNLLPKAYNAIINSVK